MVGGFEAEVGTGSGWLDVGVHLEAERVRVAGDFGAEPGEHGREVDAVGVVFHAPEFLKVVAAEGAPDTPAE